MFKLTNQIQVRNVTPEEARELLAINNFPGQRRLHPLKARHYADLMHSRRMRPVEFSIMTLPCGSKYLANGQHCAQAIILHGKPFPATVSHWKCETNEDAWHLFASFDVHGTRTEQHIMCAARGFFNEGLQEMPLRTLQCCGSALHILGDGDSPRFSGQPTHKERKPELVIENEDAVIWVHQFSDERHLMKVPVVAAMIATWRANAEEAQSFWWALKTGDNIRGSTRTLRDQLLKNEVGGSATGGGPDRAKAIYSVCVAFWNTFMRGEERRSVKLATMKEVPAPDKFRK